MSTLSKLSKLESNFADGLTTIWNEILSGLQNVAESYLSWFKKAIYVNLEFFFY